MSTKYIFQETEVEVVGAEESDQTAEDREVAQEPILVTEEPVKESINQAAAVEEPIKPTETRVSVSQDIETPAESKNITEIVAEPAENRPDSAKSITVEEQEIVEKLVDSAIEGAKESEEPKIEVNKTKITPVKSENVSEESKPEIESQSQPQVEPSEESEVDLESKQQDDTPVLAAYDADVNDIINSGENSKDEPIDEGSEIKEQKSATAECDTKISQAKLNTDDLTIEKIEEVLPKAETESLEKLNGEKSNSHIDESESELVELKPEIEQAENDKTEIQPETDDSKPEKEESKPKVEESETEVEAGEPFIDVSEAIDTVRALSEEKETRSELDLKPDIEEISDAQEKTVIDEKVEKQPEIGVSDHFVSEKALLKEDSIATPSDDSDQKS